MSEEEEIALNSWRRPIVILKTIHQPAMEFHWDWIHWVLFCPICPGITCFLKNPGMPAVVLTSGNLADEPIIMDNHEAIAGTFRLLLMAS